MHDVFKLARETAGKQAISAVPLGHAVGDHIWGIEGDIFKTCYHYGGGPTSLHQGLVPSPLAQIPVPSILEELFGSSHVPGLLVLSLARADTGSHSGLGRLLF